MKTLAALALASLVCLACSTASAQRKGAPAPVKHCTTTYVLGGAVVTCSR